MSLSSGNAVCLLAKITWKEVLSPERPSSLDLVLIVGDGTVQTRPANHVSHAGCNRMSTGVQRLVAWSGR